MLSRKVRSFLKVAMSKGFRTIKVPDPMTTKIIDASSFIALIRTHVARDHTGRYVTILPQPEVASRLAQQMTQVAVGNAVIHSSKKLRDEHLEKAVYTALCSAPSLIVYILFIIYKETRRGKQWHSIKELMMATHLGQMSTRNVIEDLCIHRVLRMRKGKSQGGRLVEYCLSRYGRKTIESVELFKNYDHGMRPSKKRAKERKRK